MKNLNDSRARYTINGSDFMPTSRTSVLPEVLTFIPGFRLRGFRIKCTHVFNGECRIWDEGEVILPGSNARHAESIAVESLQRELGESWNVEILDKGALHEIITPCPKECWLPVTFEPSRKGKPRDEEIMEYIIDLLHGADGRDFGISECKENE